MPPHRHVPEGVQKAAAFSTEQLSLEDLFAWARDANTRLDSLDEVTLVIVKLLERVLYSFIVEFLYPLDELSTCADLYDPPIMLKAALHDLVRTHAEKIATLAVRTHFDA
jgi:hypothetical protein